MKKILFFILMMALMLSVTACQDERDTAAGVYRPAGLYQTEDYVLKGDKTFRHGSIEGTYEEEQDNLILSSEESGKTITLISEGNYYYDDRYYFSEDREYGEVVAFDGGKSDQCFQQKVNETELNLEFNGDGTFVFTGTGPAPEYRNGKNVIKYEGNYALDGEILRLTWNEIEYPFVYIDGKLFFSVYEKQEKEKDPVNTRADAVAKAERDAAAERWWTKIDSSKAAEISEKAQGTWEFQDSEKFSIHYEMSFEGDHADIKMSLLGIPVRNYGRFTVRNEVFIIDYESGSGSQVVVPYTYEDGKLKIYPVQAADKPEEMDGMYEFVTKDNEGKFCKKVS